MKTIKNINSTEKLLKSKSHKWIQVLFLICFLFPVASFSQGFNWQYSSRLPSKYPYLFVGVIAETNYLIHYGYIDLTEGYSKCCTFENGNGIGNGFGLASEYWKGIWAIYSSFTFSTYPGNFTANGISLKRKLNDGNLYDVKYQNQFKSTMSYVFLEIGAKYRILQSHLHFGGGIKLGILTNNKAVHTESIVSPAEERYADGTQTQTISDGKISDLKSYVITPRIKLGYDLTFGKGLYATPSISLGLPILNIAKNAQWQTWSFTFGISIYKDLLKE